MLSTSKRTITSARIPINMLRGVGKGNTQHKLWKIIDYIHSKKRLREYNNELFNDILKSASLCDFFSKKQRDNMERWITETTPKVEPSSSYELYDGPDDPDRYGGGEWDEEDGFGIF